MIKTMERVIHPGWLTASYEDELTSDWHCVHTCVICGYAVNGNDEPLLPHVLKSHKGQSFSLELYNLRAEINRLNPYFGLALFEWKQ